MGPAVSPASSLLDRCNYTRSCDARSDWNDLLTRFIRVILNAASPSCRCAGAEAETVTITGLWMALRSLATPDLCAAATTVGWSASLVVCRCLRSAQTFFPAVCVQLCCVAVPCCSLTPFASCRPFILLLASQGKTERTLSAIGGWATSLRNHPSRWYWPRCAILPAAAVLLAWNISHARSGRGGWARPCVGTGIAAAIFGGGSAPRIGRCMVEHFRTLLVAFLFRHHGSFLPAAAEQRRTMYFAASQRL